MTPSCLGLFDCDCATVDHGRRCAIARLMIAAAIVYPTQKPRIGWMADMHGHPPASAFGEQPQFGCAGNRRITGHRRATPRRRDGLERRPTAQPYNVVLVRPGHASDAPWFELNVHKLGFN